MTNTYEALSNQRHAQLRWQGVTDYHFAAEQVLLPLVAAELPRALGQLPLVFTREAGGPRLMALLGTRPGHNLLVAADGQWQADYVPAYLRAHPFALMDQGGGQYTVGIASDSPYVSTDPNHGEPLFKEDGQPTEKVLEVVGFLKQLAQNRATTDTAAQALDDAGLLEPWPLALPDQHGEKQNIDGLYRVSDAGIKALDDATLRQLTDSGALILAYAQLLGQHRIGELIRLQNRQQEKSDQAQDMDLDQLFGEADNDVFKF